MSQAKVVLITGVAGGIGYATAQRFDQAGWRVIGLDYKANDQVDPHSIHHYISVDLSDAAAIAHCITTLKSEITTLNALVNNAALQICKPAVDMAVAEWDQVMAVNVRAPFILSQQLYPLLKLGQGSVVNVSSVHAIATSANIAAYASSKGALSALTRALAIEFAPDVRVNALLPGAVNTPMLQDGLKRGHLSGESIDDLMDDLGRKTIMDRVGKPGEIAESIYFLASNECSGFMTGQSLVVDGGAIARLSTE
ncbi:MAG: SDR family oxidoreductase [Leptolyngbyaceae bacterium]|nr:SDR family oxidoreductase [Leptolyngbyaceae bacterium]